MRLVVGLGNPGLEYQYTRHNLGFWVIDKLVEKKHLEWNVFRDVISLAKDGDCWFVKPLTYMNNSGMAIDELVRFYKLVNFELVVVHDDLDIETGRIKLQESGGSAGHNGINSILNYLTGWQVEKNWRLRLGVGGEIGKNDVADYVLRVMSVEERAVYGEVVEMGVLALEMAMDLGWGVAMNKFN